MEQACLCSVKYMPLYWSGSMLLLLAYSYCILLSWLLAFIPRPLCLMNSVAGCQQYVLKSMSNPWCLRIEIGWATLWKGSNSFLFQPLCALSHTSDDALRSVKKGIPILVKLKGAPPLFGKILVHLKVLLTKATNSIQEEFAWAEQLALQLPWPLHLVKFHSNNFTS